MTLLSYIINIVLYCIELYSIKYVPQPNETKFFIFCAKSYPYKTHVCTTTDALPISYSCCHKCKI